jgi:hypothetical protein
MPFLVNFSSRVSGCGAKMLSLKGGAKMVRKCEANLYRPGEKSKNVFEYAVVLSENNVIHTRLSIGNRRSGSIITKTC